MEPARSTDKLLTALGLSEYELRMYASAIELGRASAARIAKRAGIPRTSAYPVLEKLKEIGLVSVERRSNGMHFIAADPQALVTLSEERLAVAQDAVNASKELAHSLRSRYKRDALSSSKILIVEGRNAMRKWLFDWEESWRRSLIAVNRPWMGFQDESFLEHYGDWVHHYWERYQRAKDWQKDRVRLFAVQGPAGSRVARMVDPLAGDRRELRALPGEIKFSASVWIIGDYLAVLRTRDEPHYALQLRDTVLAENLGTVFDFLWSLTRQPTG